MIELTETPSPKPSGHQPVWTDEVENVAEKLRINCVNLAEYHRKRYYHFKGYGKYFRLPLIVLASINSTASVGLQSIVSQEIVSGITCIIGMVMGIISAVELYMGIQTSMELELKQSKEFYTLAIDIYKTLSLQRRNRGEDGKDYLNKTYSTYTKLCEASQLLRRKLKVDLLTQIPHKFEDLSPTSSNTSLDGSIEEPPFIHMRDEDKKEGMQEQKQRESGCQTDFIDVFVNDNDHDSSEEEPESLV
jgi:hypothetical protein